MKNRSKIGFVRSLALDFYAKKNESENLSSRIVSLLSILKSRYWCGVES